MLPRGLSLLDTAPALRRHQRLELRPHRRREDFRHRHIALACAAATVVPGRLGPGRSLRVAAVPWAGRLAGVCVAGRARVRLSVWREAYARQTSPSLSVAARTRLINEALHAFHQPVVVVIVASDSVLPP